MDAAPIWTDLKTFPWESFRDRVDILTGGYPCQPFSAAGKRLGKEDPRHLWPWIADGIRAMRPRICFFENVEGHISLGLREVISELEGLGYKTAWGIFSAREVGAPHQRKRVFILAYLCSEGLQGREWIRQAGEEGQPCGYVTECSGSTAWPSRPGQPQHGWEPPRVVGNAKHNGSHGAAASRGYETDTRSWSKEESEVEQQRQRASGMGSEICTGMGDTSSEGLERRKQPTIAWTSTNPTTTADWTRQAQPSLGGDSDGATNRVDDAELFITTDNRTDELRLLGNGVVPATATRAFLTLMNQVFRD